MTFAEWEQLRYPDRYDWTLLDERRRTGVRTGGVALVAALLDAAVKAGVKPGEVLALELNVDFSAAGITAGAGGPLGSLNLCGSGTSLDGMSIAQILAAANKALGNGGMPAGLGPNSLRNLLHQINDSFDNCNPHGFAQKHLTGGACP